MYSSFSVGESEATGVKSCPREDCVVGSRSESGLSVGVGPKDRGSRAPCVIDGKVAELE